MRSIAGARRVRWRVLWVAVFLLAAAPSALARNRVSCVTIRTDETVASVAQRLTGDARNMQAPWFQIVNPTTSRPVPKTRYRFIFAGWNACTSRDDSLERMAIAPVVQTSVLPAPSGPVALDAPPSRPAGPALAAALLWGPAALWSTVVLFLALTFWLVDEHLAGRRQTRRAMQQYADRFVEEFERPLVQPHLPHRPIRSKVRLKPGRSRFEVLLAPEGGLRYPNLTDHKANVMYDVVRIQRALTEHAFVSSRPYARGRWVVVPFRFRVEKGR